MNSSLLRSPFAKTAVALLFIGAIAAWALWPRHLPPPAENNRVMHMDGYSMIAPPGYTMSFETEQHTVTHNRGWMKIEPVERGHYPSSVLITVLADPPNWEETKTVHKYVEGTFHGKPSLMSDSHDKRYWNYTIIFNDQDKWFNINLATVDYCDLPNSDWWPYVDSFRYEPGKAKKPVAPATLPEFKMPTTLPAELTK